MSTTVFLILIMFVASVQAKLKNVESQLNEALLINETRTTNGSVSQAEEHSSNKATGDDMDSAVVTKRLEDELKKRDALIEVLDRANCPLDDFV